MDDSLLDDLSEAGFANSEHVLRVLAKTELKPEEVMVRRVG